MSSPTVRGRRSLKEASLSPPTASPQSPQTPGSTRKSKNDKSGLESSPAFSKSSPKNGNEEHKEDYSSDEEYNINEDEPDRAVLPDTPEFSKSKDYNNYDNASSSPDFQRSPGSPYSITSDDSFITVRSEQRERTQCNPRPSRVQKGTAGDKPSPRPCDSADFHEAQKTRRRQENDLTVAPIFVVFAMFCVLGFVVFIMPQLTKPDTDPVDQSKIKSIQDVHKDIKSSLRDLHNDLSQSRHLWTQLMGQINSVMVEEPSQPAVIVVVVPQGVQRTATCFVEKVATAIMDAFEGEHRHIMYDVKSELYGMDRTKFKWELDQALQGLSTKHVAIIHNIERIPGSAAMTFHAYCDNENAPHKRAVLLLTLEISSSYEDISEDVLDITIDNHLMRMWSKDLRETDVAAIISRMANSPILMKAESEAKVNKLCPKV